MKSSEKMWLKSKQTDSSSYIKKKKLKKETGTYGSLHGFLFMQHQQFDHNWKITRNVKMESRWQNWKEPSATTLFNLLI